MYGFDLFTIVVRFGHTLDLTQFIAVRLFARTIGPTRNMLSKKSKARQPIKTGN